MMLVIGLLIVICFYIILKNKINIKSRKLIKKTGSSFIIMILVISTMIGCANSKSNDSIVVNSKEKNGQSSNGEDLTSKLNELNAKVGRDDTIVSIKDYVELLGTKYVGSDFSDGVSWVYYDMGNAFCIDKTGKVLFISKDSVPLTAFNNGIAVLKNGNVIDRTGKVISSKDKGYDEVILQDHDGITKNKIYNGVVFVKKQTESYEGKKLEVGAIDNKGNWVLEPTSEFSTAEHVKDGIYYVGVKKTDNDKTQDIYYDVTSKKVLIKDEVDKKVYSKLTFYDDGFYDYYKEGTASNKMPLGNKVIDLSKYKSDSSKGIKTTASDFVDGYSVVYIENEQTHTKWYTIIDMSGKEMFELRKLDEWKQLGKLSCGLLKIESDHTNDFIDINGNTIIKDIPGLVNDFSEDILYVQDSHCYIDKMGKKLF